MTNEAVICEQCKSVMDVREIHDEVVVSYSGLSIAKKPGNKGAI